MLKLATVLQQNGITYRQLSAACGLSAAALVRLVKHEKWPKKNSADATAEAVFEGLRKIGIQANAGLLETAVEAPTSASANTHPSTNGENMLLRKQTLTTAAKKHFAIFRDPFDNDIQDAEDVYATPGIRYVREYLWTTGKLGGFIAIVGESGSGKSVIRKDFKDRIRREDAPIVVIEPYVLGMEDDDVKGKTLKAASIADAIIFTLAPLEKPRSSMEAKSRQVHRILRDSMKAGFSHCLIIEEAHSLSVPTLKHLKRFFEIEDGFKKLLSVVLIGQTELRTKLSERDPAVREVVQRCEIVELPPLDAHLKDYIDFKFKRIGKAANEVFDDSAFDAIKTRLVTATADGPRISQRAETISLLYPQLINNLLTAAMNTAATLGFERIDGDLIREV